MKRISLLFTALLVAAVSFAQMTRLSETVVESPTFKGSNYFNYDENMDCSPICQYLAEKLDGKSFMEQGVVAVLFTVNRNGTLSNFTLEHSISKSTDEIVLATLKSTSGYWTPGQVNGTLSQMEKKIYVRFYNPQKGTLNEQGNGMLQMAIKNYNSAKNLSNNFYLSEAKVERRTGNKLRTAIQLLSEAEKLIPTEPAVAFWQACVYEQIGNEMLSKQKLDVFNTLVDPNYQAQIESVSIGL